MTHTVWRIATDAPDYTSDDLSGAGARLSGGRWNRKGTSMLYCAESIALAALETVAHLVATALPLNRYLVRVDVPDDVMDAALHLNPANAPVGWDALPPGRVSLDFGTHWALGGASALLLVPSVIVPEERVILINPAHADADRIRATKVRPWRYDTILRH